MKICVYGTEQSVGLWPLVFRKRRPGIGNPQRGRELAAIQANRLKPIIPRATSLPHVEATIIPATLPPQDVRCGCVKAPALYSIAAGLEALCALIPASSLRHEWIP